MRARLFFVLPLALVALTACDDQSSNSAAAPSAPPPPAVDAAAPLAKEIIEWDEFNGRFHASQDVEIRPRVSGYVEAVHFRDGQMVQTGDLLFSIDKRPFEAAKSRAVAELASARARYQFANQEVERGQQLVTRGTLPKATLEQRISDRLVASADIAAAEADLRSAQLDIEFAEVRAPISGRISDSRVDVGNLVSGSGTTTLLTKIVAFDPIHFEFDMSETEYLSYERANRRGDLKSTRDGGTEIEVRLPDEDVWSYKGRIDFVDSAIDAGTGTIRVRATLPNDDGFLLPGQFGRLRLPGSSVYEAILVPESAIVSDQSRKLILTLDENNLVQPKVVRVGPNELGLRIIRNGLEKTDRIIVNGVLRARFGQPVTPNEVKIEPWPNGQPGQ